MFPAYPDLHIVHRAGRVHSNVDPISRLQRRLPRQDGPATDRTRALELSNWDDPLKNMFDELGQQFEERLLNVATRYSNSEIRPENCCTNLGGFELEIDETSTVRLPYSSAQNYSVLIGISADELKEWTEGYRSDSHFSKVLKEWKQETEWVNPSFPQYHYSDSGLIYFEDWQGNNRLCVPEDLRIRIMEEVHNTITEAAHAGYHRTYN